MARAVDRGGDRIVLLLRERAAITHLSAGIEEAIDRARAAEAITDNLPRAVDARRLAARPAHRA